MIFQDELSIIIGYAYRRYAPPKPYWSSTHFKKRCNEIWGIEHVLRECLDRPFKDPIEIIEENYYWFDIQMAHLDKAENKKIFMQARDAVYTLYTHFKK